MTKIVKPRYKFTPDPVSRSAKSYRCPSCHAFCMRGLDHDRVAHDAIVDARPLTAAGELQALLEGRVTFDLAWWGGRYEINMRYVEEIKGWPPGDRPNVDVVCAHVCGRPITLTAPYRRGGPKPYQVSPVDDECPF